MEQFLRTARRVGVTAAVVAAVALTTAPAASAAPYSCATQVYSFGARSTCSLGDGQLRAYVRCDKNNAPDYNRYGAWVPPGRWSFADCNSGDRPFNAGAQVR
ncbi:hypothetical protein [Pseudonocardia lacus]|uniref:hypothetical protein n=1 Tax=Pseudonocardia lacus TaxID=2835865 RepID=UPI001BDC0A55|nr:hypothetical protein [Pseudonocardia lacus]